ncbi:hypothetical protein AGOR_G00182480 [Albula goreensis]|uniref:C2H2-type domain-containing protein n=1 Tax=Albula goreensis TaxID=1534307 RepID=A0A8T3CVW4_9TELE|nr:hypothetical protein AGOR_G00182480 [Albula goreensis]
MLVSLRLQTELATIMDILAKSAVAEICKLIDDGSAVWQLEISRRQKENEALRRKLQLMERELEQRATRGRGREKELTAQEDGVPDVIFIKEERLETEGGKSDSTEGWKVNRENPVGSHSPADAGERGPPEVREFCEEELGVAPPPAEERRVEVFSGQHKPHPSEEEPSDFRGGVKEESEDNYVLSQWSEGTGPECSLGQPDVSGPEPLNEWDSQGCRAVEEGISDHTEDEVTPPGCIYLPSNEGSAQSSWAPPEPQGEMGTAQRQITCLYCGKHFRYLSYLKRHLRIHTGERPYSCFQCGKRFSDSSSRNKHENIHTRRKTFRCGRCGKCFSRRCHLKRHQKLHARDEPFSYG